VPTDLNAVTPGEDPWGDKKWKSDANGEATGDFIIPAEELGASAASALGRVVIVHNNAGGKIGCAVLLPGTGQGLASNGQCGAVVTGGHYDPKNKCGGSSNKQGKTDKWGNLICSAELTAGYSDRCRKEQANCEVGDQSGKMDKLVVVAETNTVLQRFRDKMLPNIGKLESRSLVLHCCDEDGSCKERIACANLVKSKGDTLKATFHDDQIEASITVRPIKGRRRQAIWKAKFEHFDSGLCPSGLLNWHVHQTSGEGLGTAQCGPDKTGGHYDPRNKCGPASDKQGKTDEHGDLICSEAFTQGYSGRCGGPSKKEQRGCEVGDQSGKTGKIKALKFSVNRDQKSLTDASMRFIGDLEGKSLVLHCCDAAGSCKERIACAILE